MNKKLPHEKQFASQLKATIPFFLEKAKRLKSGLYGQTQMWWSDFSLLAFSRKNDKNEEVEEEEEEGKQ